MLLTKCVILFYINSSSLILWITLCFDKLIEGLPFSRCKPIVYLFLALTVIIMQLHLSAYLLLLVILVLV